MRLEDKRHWEIANLGEYENPFLLRHVGFQKFPQNLNFSSFKKAAVAQGVMSDRLWESNFFLNVNLNRKHHEQTYFVTIAEFLQFCISHDLHVLHNVFIITVAEFSLPHTLLRHQPNLVNIKLTTE